MWRIGELSRMAGVSEHTLRHYDKVGLLSPAAVDRSTRYRWYGVAELTRLERIRGLARLGLTLGQIADVLDGPDADLRQARRRSVARRRPRRCSPVEVPVATEIPVAPEMPVTAADTPGVTSRPHS